MPENDIIIKLVGQKLAKEEETGIDKYPVFLKEQEKI